MRKLTSVDAQFLALESASHVGHVAWLGIVDPTTTRSGELSTSDVRSLIKDRISLMPPLTWLLQEVPFGLDLPYWVDNVDFDLDFHVREIELPRPGNEAQLAAQVARILSRPLDRARRMWEVYVCRGLEEGRIALLVKLHHALADGLSGVELLHTLLDGELDAVPSDGSARDPRSGEEVSVAALVARTAFSLPLYPLRLARSAQDALLRRASTPLGRARTADGRAYAPPRIATNDRVSPHRRVAFARVDLGRIRDLKDAHDCTVNDVVVAACAGAMRAWLLESEMRVEAPLVCVIPVSVRDPDRDDPYGNRVLSMLVPLRTDVADPVERLIASRDALREMKRQRTTLPAHLRQRVVDGIPPALMSRAARLAFRWSSRGSGTPNANLVVTNLGSCRSPLYCAGARVMAMYPLPFITDGSGLSIAVQSYDDSLGVGVVADRDQIPNLWPLATWIGEAVAELERATGPVGAPR
jgi:diacylglycerol O-acyltransferase / wax synthase